MIDASALLLGFAVGLPVSLLFFLGLWWGMRRALGSRRPALILAASFLGRAALLLGAALGLAHTVHPLWAPAGFLLAFFLARWVIVHRVRSVRHGPFPKGGC
ncbi:ATP synthase subunit I [Castellaniella sp.]|uniref:N-ATPase subunit AtpR n=1 Tax=Castellaniella sp. TaxID=1955812 RepID=UPI0035641770